MSMDEGCASFQHPSLDGSNGVPQDDRGRAAGTEHLVNDTLRVGVSSAA